MKQRFRPLACSLTLAMLAALPNDATALVRHKQKAAEATGTRHHANGEPKKGKHAARVETARHKKSPAADAPATPQLSGDLAAVKNAIDLARKTKTAEATAIEKTIGDTAGQR